MEDKEVEIVFVDPPAPRPGYRRWMLAQVLRLPWWARVVVWPPVHALHVVAFCAMLCMYLLKN